MRSFSNILMESCGLRWLWAVLRTFGGNFLDLKLYCANCLICPRWRVCTEQWPKVPNYAASAKWLLHKWALNTDPTHLIKTTKFMSLFLISSNVTVLYFLVSGSSFTSCSLAYWGAGLSNRQCPIEVKLSSFSIQLPGFQRFCHTYWLHELHQVTWLLQLKIIMYKVGI